jgi:putative toxin-antitoxin system antitoxin component (TIGR02293 family)
MITAAKIAETLGGTAVLRERLTDYAAVIHRSRAGLPHAALEAVSRRFGVPAAALAHAIDLPARTLARRKKERRLSATESDRLVRVARVAASAEAVLGDRQKAGRWLQKPNRALGRAVPLDLLGSDLGAGQIETILGRIEHGVHS